MKTLILPLLVLVSAVSAQPVASPYKPPAHSAVLGSTFFDWDALPVRSNQNGASRPVFDNPTPTLEKFEMHISTLLPGKSSHPIHQHPWEEILLIKDGDVELSINGKPQRAGPGCLVFFASHDPHNLTNIGDHPATYYVINFYPKSVHAVADRPALEQAVPGMLPSSIFDCDHLPSVPTKTGSRTDVMQSPTLTFRSLSSHISTLAVGQATAPNQVDSGEELFVVKSGLLEVTIDGVAARLAAGSFYYCVPNSQRGMRNLGTTPASYQVIKVVP